MAREDAMIDLLDDEDGMATAEAELNRAVKPTGGDGPAGRARDDGEGDDPPGGQQDDDTAERRRKRAAQRESARLRRENDELRSQVGELADKVGRIERETVSGSVAGRVAAAEAALQKARDDGDDDAIFDARLELRLAKAQRDEVDRDVRVRKTGNDGSRERVATRDEGPSEALEDWLDENPWFQRKRLKGEPGNEATELAVAISTAVANEMGLGADDPKHYAEVTKRMRRRAPELFEDKRGNGRKGPTVRDDDDDDGLDIPATAGGGRRSPSGGKPESAEDIPITRAERRIAEQSGLDLNDKETRKNWLANREDTFRRTKRIGR